MPDRQMRPRHTPEHIRRRAADGAPPQPEAAPPVVGPPSGEWLASAPPPNPTARQLRRATLQRTQRRLGNAFVARLLAQRQPAPAAPTPATQQAEAAQTMTLLGTVLGEMRRHSDQTVRNTAQLFSPRGTQPARMAFNAMTLRSDNATLVAASGQPAATTAFYFFGTVQNNQHQFGPRTGGTIDTSSAPPSIIVRGRLASGEWQTTEQIIGTFVHEASHILVASYGQHPQTTTNAASFDRYKDEFRAYWVEPDGHTWNTLPAGDQKAFAIRDHMVGRAATPPTGYPDLQNAYWGTPAFKTQVDAHRRPDGFNLTNNPNLDQLFQLLNAGVAGVDAALTHIVRVMSPAERTEANTSPLIDQKIASFHDTDAETRIHNALRFPRTDELAQELNPNRSPRIAALLEAVALRDVERIKQRFGALTPAERGELTRNAAVMLFVTRQVPDTRLRACIYAMLVNGNVGQFTAMDRFLDACLDAWVVLSAGTEQAPTATPGFLRTALRSVAYEARLALYRLVEDARRQFVDALPAPINRRVLHALREGGDPE